MTEKQIIDAGKIADHQEFVDQVIDRLKAAPRRQLLAIICDFAESLVSVTAEVPDEETYVLAALSLIDEAIDENILADADNLRLMIQ